MTSRRIPRASGEYGLSFCHRIGSCGTWHRTVVSVASDVRSREEAMELEILQVDAFTNQPFQGNPAAVCVLPEGHPGAQDASWMQSLAAEVNLSETAYLYRLEEGFSLRWFTPTIEVDLCGHATLASAHVLWERSYLKPGVQARFHTRSGLLTADRRDGWIELD